VVSFAVIVSLRPSESKGHIPEGSPVPARAK
jgi:cytochrome d ubiquinol oxidase subunit I